MAFVPTVSTFVPRNFPNPSPPLTRTRRKPFPQILNLRNAVSQPTSETKPIPTPVLRRSPFSFIIDLLRRDSGNLSHSPKYGPVYQSTFLGRSITVVSDLKAIAEIYRDNSAFASDGAWPKTTETLFGPSTLFIVEGAEHDIKRAVVQPAFAPSMFQNYFAPTVQSAYQLWDDLSQQTDRQPSTQLLQMMKDHFLRIIISVTTGLEQSQADKDEILRLRDLYVRFEKGLFSFTFGPVWNKALSAREQLLEFYDNIIRQRLVRDAQTIERLRTCGEDIGKVSMKDLKGGSIDILTVAIARSPLRTGPNQQHDPVELKRISELMLLLWFAGYSTQAASASAAVMELGFDDSIRKRLKLEQDEIIASAGTNQLTMDQILKQMPLLDSYLNEILRLFPAVATMPRLVKRDIMICGHLVKEGTNIGLDSWWAQRDPRYFEDGNVLKMDRFADRNAPMIVSFGAKGGAHYCIGAALAKVNLKVTLAVLLRDYEIELDAKQSRRYVSIPAIQPASGVKVVRCKRNESEISDRMEMKS